MSIKINLTTWRESIKRLVTISEDKENSSKKITLDPRILEVHQKLLTDALLQIKTTDTDELEIIFDEEIDLNEVSNIVGNDATIFNIEDLLMGGLRLYASVLNGLIGRLNRHMAADKIAGITTSDISKIKKLRFTHFPLMALTPVIDGFIRRYYDIAHLTIDIDQDTLGPEKSELETLLRNASFSNLQHNKKLKTIDIIGWEGLAHFLNERFEGTIQVLLDNVPLEFVKRKPQAIAQTTPTSKAPILESKDAKLDTTPSTSSTSSTAALTTFSPAKKTEKTILHLLDAFVKTVTQTKEKLEVYLPAEFDNFLNHLKILFNFAATMKNSEDDLKKLTTMIQTTLQFIHKLGTINFQKIGLFFKEIKRQSLVSPELLQDAQQFYTQYIFMLEGDNRIELSNGVKILQRWFPALLIAKNKGLMPPVQDTHALLNTNTYWDTLSILTSPTLQIVIDALSIPLTRSNVSIEILKRTKEWNQINIQILLEMLKQLKARFADAEKDFGVILLIILKNPNIALKNLPFLLNACLILKDAQKSTKAKTEEKSEEKSENKSSELSSSELSKFIQLLNKKDKPWETMSIEIKDLIAGAHENRFAESTVDEVLRHFSTLSIDVQFPLTPEEIEKIRGQMRIIDHQKTLFASMEPSALTEYKNKLLTMLKDNPVHEESKLQLLALIREQVKRSFKIFPYNVQMVNLLALINDPSHKRLAQIKTGEGKSTIISMLAAYEALCGQSAVDVITTSSDLAKRDAKKYADFFTNLGLTSGHITIGEQENDNESEETDLFEKRFKPHILFGTTDNFRFGYLWHKIERKGIGRGGRPFVTVIVDEVDNMYLDIRTQNAIIAQPDSLYSSKMLETVWSYMSAQETDKSKKALKEFLDKEFKTDVPEAQINFWLTTFSHTKHVKLNVDFISQTVMKRDPFSGTKFPVEELIIVDQKNTGQLKAGQRWSGHCFLECEYGVPVQVSNVTLAQISVINYFKLYPRIYGLTGTLGNNRAFFKNLYDINTYDSPPNRPTQRVVKTPVLVPARQGHIQSTLVDAINEIHAGRAVLIICETIEESNLLASYFYHYQTQYTAIKNIQLYNGKQEESPDTILAQAGMAGTITIATNTAGRGADINLWPDVKEKGGLHTIITFPTINERVQRQAEGRSARQGDPGSCRSIYWQGQSEFFNNTDPDRGFGKWMNARVEEGKKLTQEYLNSIKFHQFIDDIQTLFFQLPTLCKSNSIMEWGNHYTIIDREIQTVLDIIHNKPNMEVERIYNEVVLQACQTIRAFWQRTMGSKEIVIGLHKDGSPPEIKFIFNGRMTAAQKEIQLINYILHATSPALAGHFARHFSTLFPACHSEGLNILHFSNAPSIPSPMRDAVFATQRGLLLDKCYPISAENLSRCSVFSSFAPIVNAYLDNKLPDSEATITSSAGTSTSLSSTSLRSS